ncbi:hypothetical protein [Pseudomonas sp. NPDC087614]|uniref:hypothetical protein n=1 Tax=Pseudomonas sp. NPDC087614 TaxID=3364442 RepID=UPI00382A12D9
MPFVQRNEAGYVTGRFANSQPGFAEEYLPDDSPDLFAVEPSTLVMIEREWRDGAMSAVLWLRKRHRDQLEIEVGTTLSAEQFNELLVYMQALRDWPQSPDFPDSQHRPAALVWIAEQTQ